MPVDYRDAGRGRSPLIICGLVAFVLQVALGSQISFFGGCLNFMAAFACAAALQGDSGAAAITGFVAGLAYDLSATVPVGLMALVLAIGSYVVAGLSAGLGGGFSGRSFQFLAIALVIEMFVYSIALVLVGVEGDILIALGSHGLMTSLISLVPGAVFLVLLGNAGGSGRGFSARGRGTRYKGIR